MLFIDSAKTSSLEGAATTVYAQGGKGNPRLIGWDGEKVLTFTLEDALISPVSFAMLSGAGLIKGKAGVKGREIFTHATYDMVIEEFDGKKVAALSNEDRNGATIVVSKEAPVYPVTLDSAGALAEYLSAVTEKQVMISEDGETLKAATIDAQGKVDADSKTIYFVLAADEPANDETLDTPATVGTTVRIDCYEVHGDEACEIQIDAENFAGYYYIEADTLFRDEETGNDVPAKFVIPRGKIQSNFTFTMANSGDPSSFTFTIDCFPAYTKFNKKKKVMAALQVISATAETHNYKNEDIRGHSGRVSDNDTEDWYTKSVFDSGN